MPFSARKCELVASKLTLLMVIRWLAKRHALLVSKLHVLRTSECAQVDTRRRLQDL